MAGPCLAKVQRILAGMRLHSLAFELLFNLFRGLELILFSCLSFSIAQQDRNKDKDDKEALRRAATG